MRGRALWVVPWLVILLVAQVAALAAVRQVFVGSIRGQLLDTAALNANTIGQRHIDGLVDAVLGGLTVVSLVIATVAIGFIALARRRVLLAVVATVLIAGANLTSQLLKEATLRPDLGIDVERAGAGNSLPSGHATVAASVAVALVLVLPSRVRGLAGVIGVGYAGVAGVATVSAGWHRPSDAVAALLVVGAWAALAGLVLAIAAPDRGEPSRPHRTAVLALGLTGLGLLAVAAVAMALTHRAVGGEVEALESLGRPALLTAYAGGAAGILGTAAVVMGLILATVHVIVRRHADPDRTPADWPAPALT
jgi:membrane-associated phospholipid phosphatase